MSNVLRFVPRVGLCLGLLFASAGLQGSPVITELMASNTVTLTDQDGDYAAWLELYNPDSAPADLTGWYLSNKASNPTKWKFPAFTVPAGASVVIFCSGKNYINPTAPLATNFSLANAGGYVGLTASDGTTVISSYNFPVQNADISYGITQPTDPKETVATGYFATPTPGKMNGGAAGLLLADRVVVGTPPGIFAESTSVVLSGASPTEQIRYNLITASSTGDAGGCPTSTSMLYSGPVTITSTCLVRAAVFSADGTRRGLPSSAMYIQVDDSSPNRLDNFSSPLPMIVFDNNGLGALTKDDLYHSAWIGAFNITSTGSSTLMQKPDFFSPDGMKLHGFSSATWPKQSYDVDLSDDLGNSATQAFLGLDVSKSWVTVAPWDYDRTYIHNGFVYSLYRGMGYWAPTSRPVEMFIHSGGGPLDFTSYAGLTALTDRLKIAATRINIYSLAVTDITAPNVTGGYILKIDHPDDDSYSWTTTGGATVLLDTPKLDVLVPAQRDYISGYVQQMENALVADAGSGYATRNYLGYIDRPSWIDYHLLNVFVENDDAFQFSEYFTKDVNGPIKAGPTWDYDRAMGSVDGRDANPEQWTPDQVPDLWNIGWWTYLTHDPDFMQAWIDRWQTLRQSLLATPNLTTLADTLAAQVGPAAAARDSARWNDDQSRFVNGWQGEVDNMKSWLTRRAAWIDLQFAPVPSVVAAGSSVTLAPPPGLELIYTLDGSDPRLSGGGVAPAAFISSAPVALSATQGFSARSYNPAMATVFPGSPWSSPVTVIGSSTASVGRFSAIACRTQVGTGDNILIAGFVVSGAPGVIQQVLIRGVGPGLGGLGVTGFLAAPSLAVYDSNQVLVATNTGWGSNPNAAAVATATATVGDFALAPGSADSALLVSLAPGAYTVQLTGVNAATGNGMVEIYQVGQTAASVVDVASRAVVSPASGPLIAGLVITGGTAQVLVRGDGPALAQYGVSDPLAKPILQVYDASGRLLASNTGWGTNSNSAQIATAAAGVGAFPLTAGSADSALLLTLPPGDYTMQVSTAGSASGNALAECYLVP